jgi:hypothetical protein
MPIMKAVELQGEIDDHHRLHADVSQSLPADARKAEAVLRSSLAA